MTVKQLRDTLILFEADCPVVVGLSEARRVPLLGIWTERVEGPCPLCGAKQCGHGRLVLQTALPDGYIEGPEGDPDGGE